MSETAPLILNEKFLCEPVAQGLADAEDYKSKTHKQATRCGEYRPHMELLKSECDGGKKLHKHHVCARGYDRAAHNVEISLFDVLDKRYHRRKDQPRYSRHGECKGEKPVPARDKACHKQKQLRAHEKTGDEYYGIWFFEPKRQTRAEVKQHHSANGDQRPGKARGYNRVNKRKDRFSLYEKGL